MPSLNLSNKTKLVDLPLVEIIRRLRTCMDSRLHCLRRYAPCISAGIACTLSYDQHVSTSAANGGYVLTTLL
jgi:hypothetical protein